MSRAVEIYAMSLGRRCTHRQRCLVMILAIHHQESRETFWPSNATIAEMMGTDEREVRRTVAELVEMGILRTQPGFGRQRTSYEFPEVASIVREGAGEGRSTPGRQGWRQGDFTTRNKVLQHTKSKAIQEPRDFDFDAQHHGGEVFSVSSSANPHDDIEVSPSDLQRVIRAFEESPVTKGKVSIADIDMARRLLGRNALGYTVTQVENGITLGTIRKMMSDRQHAKEGLIALSQAPKVQSLAYFEGAIEEAANDRNLKDSHIQHMKTAIEGNIKKPQGVVAS